MIAIWTLYEEELGKSDIGMTFSHAKRHVPYSVARVCWKCGDCWSKIKVEHPDSTWVMSRRLCPKCGPGVMNEHQDDLYVMPTEVAMREIKHMKLCKDYEIHLITGGSERDLIK